MTVAVGRHGQSALRQLASLASGTAVGQLALLAVSPIISRQYTEADMGVLGLGSSFLSVGVLIGTLRYEQAIVSTADDSDARRLFSGARHLLLVTCGSAAVGLATLSLIGALGFGKLAPLAVALLFIVLLGASLLELARYLLIRFGDFRAVSRMTVDLGVTKAAALVALGVAGAGWVGLLLAEILSRIFALIRLRRPVLLSLGPPSDRRESRGVLLAYSRFPRVNLPSSLLNTAAAAAHLPIVTSLYGLEVAGAYAFLQRIVAVPASLVGRSVGDVFHARITPSSERPVTNTVGAFVKALALLVLVATPPALVALAWGGPLFAWVFGEPWRSAGVIGEAMATGLAVQFVVSPLSRVVLVADRLRSKLVFDVTFLVLTLMFAWYAREHELALTRGAELLNLVFLVSYGVFFAVILVVLRAHHHRTSNAEVAVDPRGSSDAAR